MTRYFKDNLLVQFSTVSLVIMAILALILALVLTNKIQSDARVALVAEAVGNASWRVHTIMTPADLAIPMTGARYTRFHEFVQQSIISEQTARVKLWAKDGTVIYSDDPAVIGSKFPENEDMQRALRGEVISEIRKPANPEHVRERYLGTLIEVYAPIVFPGSMEPQGVMELYQYYEPTAQRIADLRRWVFGSIGVGFVILYGGLIFIVGGGWRTINRQQATLARTNADLRRANEEIQKAQESLVLMLHETKTRAEKLRVLTELSQTVTATLDPRQVFDLIIRAISELLDAAVATVWILEDDALVLRAGWGAYSTLWGDRAWRPGEGLVGWIAQYKQPLGIFQGVAEDSHVTQAQWALPEGLQAFAGVPLLVESRCLGVIMVGRSSPCPFGADEMEFLSVFANQAAVAVENAQLYRQLKEMTVLEERERIAREMHDGLAQQLGYLYLEIRRLETNPCISPLQQEFHRIRKVAAVAYEEIRQAIFGLNMRVSRGLGLLPTLTEYLHEFGKQTSIAVALDIPDKGTTKLSAHVEVQLIRIIQEALGNTRKHAHAQHVWVSFGMEEGMAKITIRDDGRGFDPEEVQRLERACLGLQSMQDRVLSVGGMILVESQPGQGTQVSVWLPVEIQEGKLSKS
jgi:signal transduction histidine kinase